MSWKAALLTKMMFENPASCAKGEYTRRRDVSKESDVESADVYTHYKV